MSYDFGGPSGGVQSSKYLHITKASCYRAIVALPSATCECLRRCLCSMDADATPSPAKRARGPPVNYTEDTNHVLPPVAQAPTPPPTSTALVLVPVEPNPPPPPPQPPAPDNTRRLPPDAIAGRADACFLLLEQLPADHHLVTGKGPKGKGTPTHMCVGVLSNGKKCMTPIKLIRKARGPGFRPWLATQHMQSIRHRNSPAYEATGGTPSVSTTQHIGSTLRLLSDQKQLVGAGTNQEQLTAQARWAVYGKPPATASAFDNHYFRQMLLVQNPRAVFLHRRTFNQFVEREWNTMIVFLKHANKLFGHH